MKEKIEFQRESLIIRGHVWGRQDRMQDAVILSHGFLANERMCHRYAKLLADMGLLAVTFDFCGGGMNSRSDGKSKDMTVLTEKEDLLAVVKGVEESFSPKSISLLGCSQGGFVSGLLAAELGAQEIGKLIMFYPALCIPDDARKGKMMFYKFDPDKIPEVLGRFPMEIGKGYAEAVISMDPYEEMKGYEGPVLLVHGTEDKIVDISYARKLRTIYPDIRYEEIKGGGHMFKGEADEKACEILHDFMSTAHP